MMLTVESVKALKPTSNNPQGDFFVGTKEELDPVIDAMVADSSLLSPMYLYVAAGTAFRLNRPRDAGLLFYQAQLRKAFEFKRFNIETEANGNNAATYLAFLNQTAGQNINPAITQDPKAFADVIKRLESWEIIPSEKAYEPELEEAKGFRLKPSEWPKVAGDIKESFMSKYGRPTAKRLNDPRYFEAFLFSQKFNLGQIDRKDPANQKSYEEMQQRLKTLNAKP